MLLELFGEARSVKRCGVFVCFRYMELFSGFLCFLMLSWSSLGVFWTLLGESWDSLVLLYGLFWGLLGRPWPLLGVSWVFFGGLLGRFLRNFSITGHFGGPWMLTGSLFHRCL